MKAVAVFLMLLFIGVITLLHPLNVMAASTASWNESWPVVLSDVPLAARPGSGCVTYSQDLFISELQTTKNVCVYGGERLKIGEYLEGNVHHAVVQLPFSEEVHVLNGICTAACQYSPDTDVLVTTQQISQSGRGLVIFKHASQRIKKETLPGGVVNYSFDSSHVDYEMTNEVGAYIPTPSFNVSDNGRWVVAELQNKGIAVTDTVELTTRQITTQGYQYGVGFDPVEQLAVSNNGRSVAVTGMNVGLQIFDVISGCGQSLKGDLLRPIALPCPSGDIGIAMVAPSFRQAERPRFFGDGHQLEIVVDSWVGNPRRITFGTTGTAPLHKLKLLSIGDSFSSGEGETDTAFYLPGTDEEVNNCHVSTRAYPGVIAGRLGIGDDDAKNVACAGATIEDVIGSEASYFGQDGRLAEAGIAFDGKAAAQQEAVDNFQPGKALQSSFITRYSPQILTIGIGGNDAGLMGKLRTCAMPGTCEWAQPDGIKETAGEIQRLSGKLDSLFSSLVKDTESTSIFVVGYPQIIDPEGNCDPITGSLFDHNERVFIQNSIHYLDQVIQSAVNKAGFTYLDTEDSLKGQNLCSGASEAMNGVRTGSDIAPIGTLPMLKLIGAGTFHPTPKGHSLMADSILARHPDLSSGARSVNNLNLAPSLYWSSESDLPTPEAYATNFAFKDSQEGHMKIGVSDDTLQPGSEAVISVRSDPLQIATMTVGMEGGLSGDISLPLSLEDGFHTLHLLGKNREGVSIDMYQSLTVGKENVALDLPSSVDARSNSLTMQENTATSPLHGANSEKTSLTQTPSMADVLGASVQKVTSLADHDVKKAIQNGWLLSIIIGGIATTMILLYFLFLRRRWAKPSS